jgi:hypothetical protein
MSTTSLHFNLFGLDTATMETLLLSFNLVVLNVPRQTMADGASIPNKLDSLRLKFIPTDV